MIWLVFDTLLTARLSLFYLFFFFDVRTRNLAGRADLLNYKFILREKIRIFEQSRITARRYVGCKLGARTIYVAI